MTDKEKFLKLFNEIGIEYKQNELSIEISDRSTSSYHNTKFRWGEVVSIIFDENDNFKYFEGWGE